MTRFARRENEVSRATLPVIMLSVHSRLSVVTQARDSRIQEFVVKPFSARSLMAHGPNAAPSGVGQGRPVRG